MRAPRRRRPLRRKIADSFEGADVLALRVHYVGSPDHKEAASFAGQPRPRADASLCDPELGTRRSTVTRWLRIAFRKGAVSEFREGDFPRYVWYKRGEQVFEGRLTNREQGHYKGYPLERDEWPAGIEVLYG